MRKWSVVNVFHWICISMMIPDDLRLKSIKGCRKWNENGLITEWACAKFRIIIKLASMIGLTVFGLIVLLDMIMVADYLLSVMSDSPSWSSGLGKSVRNRRTWGKMPQNQRINIIKAYYNLLADLDCDRSVQMGAWLWKSTIWWDPNVWMNSFRNKQLPVLWNALEMNVVWSGRVCVIVWVAN